MNDDTLGEGAVAEAVYAHVEGTLGEIEIVSHELDSPLVHLDVFAVAPVPGRPFRTLITCGMSELPMTGAPSPELERMELCAFLPPDWPVDEAAWQREERYWPVRLLKLLARLPHDNQTWLWREHTVPNGDPPEPYAPGTELCGAMVVPPLLLPEEFAVMDAEPGSISFFAILPLHRDEMELKVRAGADALYDRLEEAATALVVDPARPSAV